MAARMRVSVTRIIAHVDHGKTTIMDSIIAKQGYISKNLAGDIRYLDSRPDEQKREITLKLGFIGLRDGNVFIDTPGHVDFESLVFSSALLADNHLIVIDVNEGITPRANTLVKYVNPSMAVLILNKIDKCKSFDVLEAVVAETNGLMGSEVFDWAKKNVVLSDALNCCGISFQSNKLTKKNSMKGAFKFYKALCELWDMSETKTSSSGSKSTISQDVESAREKVGRIAEKYRIRYKSKKNVLSAVMPLSEAITLSMESLDAHSSHNPLLSAFYSISLAEECSQSTHAYNHSLLSEKAPRDNENGISSKKIAESQEFVGLTSCGILKDRHVLEEENVLFVCKVLKGVVQQGASVLSISQSESREVTIEKIYKFEAERLVEVADTSGTPLVCFQGSFLKNSLITTTRMRFCLSDVPVPFFGSKIILRDLSQLEKIKRAIRTLSYVEQPLRARKNKFCEIEIQCSGRVQFEKICNDLHDSGFSFDVREESYEFRETVTKTSSSVFSCAEYDFKVQVFPFDPKKDSEEKVHDEGTTGVVPHLTNSSGGQLGEIVRIRSKNNMFVIRSVFSAHIVESVLEIFTESGPLISEKIINTVFVVDFLREEEKAAYNVLSNEIKKMYMDADPIACPRVVDLKITLCQNYLGTVYSILQKNFYIMGNEDIDEKTDFSIIRCKIPVFCLGNFSEEVAIRTRGTGYVEVTGGDEYAPVSSNLDTVLSKIRREKGLHLEEKVVQNPERQRTLKK